MLIYGRKMVTKIGRTRYLCQHSERHNTLRAASHQNLINARPRGVMFYNIKCTTCFSLWLGWFWCPDSSTLCRPTDKFMHIWLENYIAIKRIVDNWNANGTSSGVCLSSKPVGVLNMLPRYYCSIIRNLFVWKPLNACYASIVLQTLSRLKSCICAQNRAT